jgi:hypothetical protein
MTTTNTWPGKPGVPLNPEKDGWHWLSGVTERPAAFEWLAHKQAWLFHRAQPEAQAMPPHDFRLWTYLGPCLTPDQATALQARVEELEVETKKAKFIHQYEVKELQARATKLTRLVEILVENDPEDMAADAVTVLDVWRKEACELLARHARLDARQAAMEKMRENESAEIRAALEGKKDEV